MKWLTRVFLFCASVGFFSTAYADMGNPVGFVSVSSPEGSDITFGPPFHQAPAFSGSIGSITNGDTITVASSPGWTVDEFAGTHYVLISNGNREGMFASIASNTADSLTLTFISETLGDEVGDRVEVGNGFKVIPFWTFGTLLPNGSVPDQTKVLVYDRAEAGINKAGRTVTYFDGFGWFSGPTPKDNEVIYPDESIVLRPPSGVSLDFSVTGSVPTSNMRASLYQITQGESQDIRCVNPFPVEVALQDLFSPGAAGDGDKVLMIDNSETGINKAGRTITYFDGFGWYAGPTDKNEEPIAPGQGIIYRKAATNTTDLVVTQIPEYQQN